MTTTPKGAEAAPDSPGLKWLREWQDKHLKYDQAVLSEQFRLAADELERALMDVRQLKVAESLLTAELEQALRELRAEKRANELLQEILAAEGKSDLERVTKERDALRAACESYGINI